MSKHSGRLLPVHPNPLPDELLSSWVYRLAMSNFQKIRPFTQLLLDKRSFWARDMDRVATNEVLSTIAIRAGKPLKEIKQTTFRGYEGIVYEDFGNGAITKGILAVGMYHRVHKRFGQMYCPQCLAESPPYYRKTWRVAFVTGCHKHQCHLEDRCPNCQMPISFNRCDNEDRVFPSALTINHCHNCEYDLSKKPVRKLNAYDAHAVGVVTSGIKNGWVDIGNNNIIYSNLYFKALRKIIYILASSKYGGKLRQYFRQQDHFKVREKPLGELEKQSLKARSVFVNPSVWLLSDWPYRLIQVFEDAGIERLPLHIINERTLPYFLDRVLKVEFVKQPYTPSYEEFISVEAHLKKIGIKANNINISGVLGIPSQPQLYNEYRKRASQSPHEPS